MQYRRLPLFYSEDMHRMQSADEFAIDCNVDPPVSLFTIRLDS